MNTETSKRFLVPVVAGAALLVPFLGLAQSKALMTIEEDVQAFSMVCSFAFLMGMSCPSRSIRYSTVFGRTVCCVSSCITTVPCGCAISDVSIFTISFWEFGDHVSDST